MPITTRRSVLLGGSTACLMGTKALASPLNAAGSSPDDTQALEQLMARTLEGELQDAAVAQRLASCIIEAGFRWKYPTFSVRDADSVVAYSFGYRSATGKVDPDTGLADGDEAPQPGPINALLAEVVHALRKMRDLRVYAQWEIAEVLRKQYGMADILAIYPQRGNDGKKIYLSTDGVAKAVIARAGTAQALGRVAVVGHRDHVKRCILVSRDNGMNAAAAREVMLPVQYDPGSAQPWTRRRDAYLLNDVIAQLTMARSRI